MKNHLYAFGSLCRGEIDQLSDVDLLACIPQPAAATQLDASRFSIYTHDRLKSLWIEGNPFAWHLHLESRLLFSPDGEDFLKQLGAPKAYGRALKDCDKFKCLLKESYDFLLDTSDSQTFHLSCIFLATRNFATCYSFMRGRPCFSRMSPFQIDRPIPLTVSMFDIFLRARVLSTRGIGEVLSAEEITIAIEACENIYMWMDSLHSVKIHI